MATPLAATGPSDEGRMVLDVAARLFGGAADADAADGVWPGDRWDAVEAAGLPLALVPEAAGGFGLAPADALAVVALAAGAASPLPLGETMIANWLLAGAGLRVAAGPAAFGAGALSLRRDGGGWVVAGTLTRLPWGRRATIAAVAQGDAGARLVRLEPGPHAVSAGTNIAGEPRDTLIVETVLGDADVGAEIASDELALAGAVLRAVQIGGALEAVLDMTLAFVRERQQFGKSLGGFQAIQHQLAVLAEEVVSGRVAGDLAAATLTEGLGRHAAVAVAKVRAGEAAGRAAAIAHQMHGAMGFTREYPLHRLVRRLWAWRDEFGGEAIWAERLGRELARAGGEGLWPALTVIG